MLTIQIFLIAFFLLALSRVWLRYKANELSTRGAGVWTLFWLAAGVVVIRPDSTAWFAKLLGVGRGADLVIYAALATLFFMMFRLMVKVEKTNRELTKAVRQKALDEADKDLV